MNLLHSWEDNVPTILAIFQIWSSVDCWCMIVAVCEVAHFRSKMDWPSQCTKCPIPPISPSWESDLCTPTLIFFRRSYFSQNSAEPHHFPSFAEYASPKHHFITVYSHCAPFRTIFTYSRIIVTIRQLLFQLLEVILFPKTDPPKHLCKVIKLHIRLFTHTTFALQNSKNV